MKRKIFSNINYFFYLALIFLFGGCVTPKAIISLNEDDSHRLLQNPIGVIVFVPDKNIYFIDTVGLITSKSTSYSFEGIWDPSIIIKNNLIKTFQEKSNLTVIPLWEKLEQDVYNKIIEESEIAFQKEDKIQDKLSRYYFDQYPPYSYLKAKPHEGILSLRDTLGINYVLELYQSTILINHTPLFLTRVFICSCSISPFI